MEWAKEQVISFLSFLSIIEQFCFILINYCAYVLILPIVSYSWLLCL